MLTGRGIQRAEAAVAVGLEGAHTEFVGQGQGLLVGGFGLRDIGGIGVSMDNAQLVQRERLVPAFLVLPGQVERLARVLPGLLAVSRQTTDLAEPCDLVGQTSQPARADTFADRLLQQCAPLREAPLERIGRAQARRNRRNQFRLPEARQRARPRSSTRTACSRSPWARYRRPR